MFRTLSLVSALVLATAFSVSDGAAQAKKKVRSASPISTTPA